MEKKVTYGPYNQGKASVKGDVSTEDTTPDFAARIAQYAAMEKEHPGNINYKYDEDMIIGDFQLYLDSTYVGEEGEGNHYVAGDDIQCFDAWIAMGDSTPTFRNTAMKYLWRYGKKNGNNKKDLWKAMHYILLCLHVDHYKDMEY